MLKEFTKQYIAAFNSKDLAKLAFLLREDCVLEDPVVKRINGKKNVLQAMKGIFQSCNILNFSAKNIYHENDTTIIEFVLKLDDTILTGTDIIEWEDSKIKELRAYLDIPKG